MKDYSFGNYICALRMGLGLSQFQLGTLVGVTDKAVSKWENGNAKPKISTCRRLAEVLGVTLTELLSCEQYTTTSARKELDKMNQRLWKQAYERLSIYGKNPPAACWSRLATEETAFYGTDAVQSFAVLGKVRKAAQECDSDIMVTGAINSSYAAWLFGATTVNPLQPHYRCPTCGNIEFVSDIADGFDLAPKSCICGEHLLRDGHNIPFEGYAKSVQNGSWIDVRVSDSFMARAAEVLKDFYKDTAEILPVRIIGNSQEENLDIYVVLPGNKIKPELSEDGFWHTTMDKYWDWREGETSFSFYADDSLNRIEQLVKKRGVVLPNAAELANKAIMEQLFRSRLEKYPAFDEKLGKNGVQNFDLLMRMDGFRLGSWDCNNIPEMIGKMNIGFLDAPAFREDVWNDIAGALTNKGINENGLALLVMDLATKGKFYWKRVPEEIFSLLSSLALPNWYLDYLSTVMYLFPKGHCVALLIKEMLEIWLREKV